MLFLENIKHRHGNCSVTSYYTTTNYFPITACLWFIPDFLHKAEWSRGKLGTWFHIWCNGQHTLYSPQNEGTSKTERERNRVFSRLLWGTLSPFLPLICLTPPSISVAHRIISVLRAWILGCLWLLYSKCFTVRKLEKSKTSFCLLDGEETGLTTAAESD